MVRSRLFVTSLHASTVLWSCLRECHMMPIELSGSRTDQKYRHTTQENGVRTLTEYPPDMQH